MLAAAAAPMEFSATHGDHLSGDRHRRKRRICIAADEAGSGVGLRFCETGGVRSFLDAIRLHETDHRDRSAVSCQIVWAADDLAGTAALASSHQLLPDDAAPPGLACLALEPMTMNSSPALVRDPTTEP